MKILIVDDELLVRISLRVLLDKLGQVNSDMVDADCGQAMLELLERERFDLAFVDIRMPGMSGLEAIEQGKRLSPDTLFYILTGFGEFEFAREAVRLGVEDYLLKPVTREMLAEVLDRARDRAAHIGGDEQLEVTRWLASFALGTAPRELPFRGSAAALLLVDDVFFDTEGDGAEAVIQQMSAQGGAELVWLPGGEQCPGLLLARDEAGLMAAMVQLDASPVPVPFTLYRSGPRQENGEIADALRLLRRAADLRPLLGTGGVRTVDGPHAIPQDGELAEVSALCLALRQNLKAGDYVRAMTTCDSLVRRVEVSGLLEHGLYGGRLAAYLSTLPGFTLEENPEPEQLRKALNAMCADQLQQQPKDAGAVARRMLDYVHSHYCESLSVASVAEALGLTPNYCSALFRKETGVRFTDYLTGLRIKRAKQLMGETSLSIKEITAQVGYYSQSHFIKLFLRSEGCTPNEYRSR